MIQAIERKVGIRKIWRCRAGWGMSLCIRDYLKQPPLEGVVYAYQPTMEKCVEVNYCYWVLGKNQRGYPNLIEYEFVKTNKTV